MQNKNLVEFLDKHTNDTLSKIKSKDPKDRIYERLLPRMISFVSYLPRTVREVSDKFDIILQKFAISQEEKTSLKNKLIQYFLEIKLIDDQKYLKDFVLSKQNSSKKKSPNQIKLYLMKKGFSTATIDKALRALGETYSDTYIQDFIRKKSKTFDYSDIRKSKQKFIRLLASKGVPLDKAIGYVDTFFKVK